MDIITHSKNINYHLILRVLLCLIPFLDSSSLFFHFGNVPKMSALLICCIQERVNKSCLQAGSLVGFVKWYNLLQFAPGRLVFILFLKLVQSFSMSGIWTAGYIWNASFTKHTYMHTTTLLPEAFLPFRSLLIHHLFRGAFSDYFCLNKIALYYSFHVSFLCNMYHNLCHWLCNWMLSCLFHIV